LKFRPIDDFKTMLCPVSQGMPCLMDKCPSWETPEPLPDMTLPNGENPPTYYNNYKPVWVTVSETEVHETEYVPVKDFFGRLCYREAKRTGRMIAGHVWHAQHTVARCNFLMQAPKSAARTR